jgi:hypothetical protein
MTEACNHLDEVADVTSAASATRPTNDHLGIPWCLAADTKGQAGWCVGVQRSLGAVWRGAPPGAQREKGLP